MFKISRKQKYDQETDEKTRRWYYLLSSWLGLIHKFGLYVTRVHFAWERKAANPTEESKTEREGHPCYVKNEYTNRTLSFFFPSRGHNRYLPTSLNSLGRLVGKRSYTYISKNIYVCSPVGTWYSKMRNGFFIVLSVLAVGQGDARGLSVRARVCVWVWCACIVMVVVVVDPDSRSVWCEWKWIYAVIMWDDPRLSGCRGGAR